MDAVEQAQKTCHWDKSVDGYIEELDGREFWQDGQLDSEFQTLYNDLHYCMFTQGYTTKNTLKQLIPLMVKLAADQINQTTPLNISEEVRLDSAANKANELQLTHTLIEDEIDDIDVPRFTSLYQTVVLNNVCNAEQSKKLLRNGVVFSYSYYDRNGQFVADLKVSEGDC
ncbi:hypothetical protein A8L45_11750 [Veronia pacifica]|uniref:Uncharacterized protein n=2 Tax=Veronia pacifica TaxID=1080227 RepID=A0A1C3EIP4_9GAMM|nr:hypothetical protein A8L45_11750 [Veronia pacifica]